MAEDHEPEDPSWLKDQDWIEVNKLRSAYKDGGHDAVEAAWHALWQKDHFQFARIACAYDPARMPRRIKEAIEDVAEDAGYTFEELIELGKKKQH